MWLMRFLYTVYLNKTDEVVACGTAAECAEQMNKSLNCFYSTVSKNRKGLRNKYTVLIEQEGADDEGEEEEEL